MRMQMLTQTMTILHRQQRPTLTMDDDASGNAATQTMCNDADDDNAAADVNTATKKMR
jgi:hypothetical protein